MGNKPIDHLNMIPFIDIMLVLLAIVLTTSSFIASGRIPLQLPDAATSEPDSKPSEMIEIDAAGKIYHGEKAVSLNELRSRLAPLDRETPFLLRADKTVQLQRFIDVADVLKQLNFTRVAVQTQARAGDDAP
ncbi:MAG: biopolymer transporter ExbD [Azoarcus sp.]|nr:biopolymer transporter ExbD [Azoarcus sp.]